VRKFANEREREREREREGGGLSMVNAQEWLDSKFATEEARREVVVLFISSEPGTDQNEFIDC
jgi:hypothetical protein